MKKERKKEWLGLLFHPLKEPLDPRSASTPSPADAAFDGVDNSERGVSGADSHILAVSSCVVQDALGAHECVVSHLPTRNLATDVSKV